MWFCVRVCDLNLAATAGCVCVCVCVCVFVCVFLTVCLHACGSRKKIPFMRVWEISRSSSSVAIMCVIVLCYCAPPRISSQQEGMDNTPECVRAAALPPWPKVAGAVWIGLSHTFSIIQQDLERDRPCWEPEPLRIKGFGQFVICLLSQVGTLA